MIKDSGLRRGKLKYMSPEVYQVVRYDGYKADIWSLGVVLWGMITGGLIYRKPILADYRFGLLTKGQEGLKELLQLDEVSDVSPSLLHLLSKMLDVNAETRYLIQDVLSHPWVWAITSNPKSSQFPPPEEQKEEKKICSTPLSPPRILRTSKMISTTPTVKTETMSERSETRGGGKEGAVVTSNPKTFQFPSPDEQKEILCSPRSPPRTLRSAKGIATTPTVKIETVAEEWTETRGCDMKKGGVGLLSPSSPSSPSSPCSGDSAHLSHSKPRSSLMSFLTRSKSDKQEKGESAKG